MTKETYANKFNYYRSMATPRLEGCIGDLYKLKFEDNDISVYEEHRIASRALIERNRDGTGLIFHMQNLQVKKS